MKRTILFLAISALGLASCGQPQSRNTEGLEDAKYVFDYNDQQQTMHSFGASDCWRTKYVGNWPDEKRNAIADLLFSQETDAMGNPKGIGLSMWRFNIGAGSTDAGISGGVLPEWRREECFLDKDGNWDWNKQAGAQWMLHAARERGLKYSLGFSISAPYFMTRNGMSRTSNDDAYCNIRPDQFDDFADFLTEVSNHLELDYLSPINEPQWNWISDAQEGMQATNEEVAHVCRELDRAFQTTGSKTKVVFGEVGDINYLFKDNTNRPLRDNQIEEIFSENGANSIYGLSAVAPIVSGHSYWSTWPLTDLVANRENVRAKMKEVLPENYTYWQTEYCPMEANPDNPNGGGRRDLGINTALYIARVMHYDITAANAASWQSWTAFTEWDYKDGLIYIDDGHTPSGARSYQEPMIESCKKDGHFRDSKMLWGLGNFSFFVRPGMIRLGAVIGPEGGDADDASHLMVSAYADNAAKKVVAVAVNFGAEDIALELDFRSLPAGFNTRSFKMYETSSRSDLQYKGEMEGKIVIPARSIVTLVSNN